MPLDDRMDDAREWLRYAEADLAFAGVPLPEKGMLEQLVFHAQQAAEKAIKAVLESEGVIFPKTHSIEFLLTLLPAGVSREDLPTDADKLTGYATVFRYPGEATISYEDYRRLLGIAQKTVKWANAWINAGNSV